MCQYHQLVVRQVQFIQSGSHPRVGRGQGLNLIGGKVQNGDVGKFGDVPGYLLKLVFR